MNEVKFEDKREKKTQKQGSVLDEIMKVSGRPYQANDVIKRCQQACGRPEFLYENTF